MSAEHNITANQTSSSTFRKVGRKRSWWPTECFSLQPDNDSVVSSDNLFNTCNGCGWQTRAATQNATQLGQHLLQCPFTSPGTLQRLLKSPSLLRAYQKLGSSSECFGVPITPDKQQFASNLTALNKRRLSDGGITEDDGKRQKIGNIKEEFEKKVSKLHDLFTRLAVHHMLPFSILSRRQQENELVEIVKLLNPAFVDYVPTIARLAGKNVDGYYDRQLKEVKCAITSSLRQSYGTLIFDGWTDANSENVVNVLITITGINKSRTTYFLRSIYTGSANCDASFYANIVDSVFQQFGEMTRISGVVSDNTSSCIKAKEELAKNHNHLIPSQDQTHVANLLMQDLGELQWVSDIIGTVSGVVSDLRKHSKLYFRYKQLKDQYNSELRNRGYTTQNREFDTYGRVLPIKTAVLPMKMAATRFASSEGMIHSFLRGKPVFQKLVNCPDFSKHLFGGKNTQRRERFEAIVRDCSLYDKCLDVYHVLRVMRQYLRIFDDDSSLISEVYPATDQLRTHLQALPVTPFFTTQRKQQVMETFRRRIDDVSRRIPLLTPIHYVAYLLDVRSVNADSTLHTL